MTRKHYRMIADILRKASQAERDDHGISFIVPLVAKDMADAFAKDNEAFVRLKFLQAAGVAV